MEIQLVVAFIYHVAFLGILFWMFIKVNRYVQESPRSPKQAKALSKIILGGALLLALGIGVVARVVYYVLSQGVV